MNIRFFYFILFSLIFLNACNKGSDPNELRLKSQARGDIIQRSGTTLKDEKEALIDAENRLRTGGGLLGKKPTAVTDLLNNNGEKVVGSMGLPINPILWKSSLETINFMPIASADPFGGIIITDWYSANNEINERCKLNIFIKGVQLKSDNLRVNSFCQIYNESGIWVDQATLPLKDREIENAILNNAKKIKLSLN